VYWYFEETLTELVSSVVDGVVSSVTYVFDGPTATSVVASFKDGAGTLLGKTTVKVDVGLGAPRVDSVTPAAVSIDVPLTFLVRGVNLPVGLGFSLQECIGIMEIVGGGSNGERRFSCTFPAGTLSGVKEGSISNLGNGGNPFGEVLRTFSVTALPPAGSVAVFTVTPERPSIGETITLIADGVGLSAAGFKFSNFPPCETGGAVAPTTLSDTTMSFSCTATVATTVSYVGVLDAEGVPLPGVGQSLAVFCPGGVEPVDGLCVGSDLDHLGIPALYDNAGSAQVTFGQTFEATADTISGIVFYIGDPTRPDDARVDSLTGLAELRLYEVAIDNTVTLLAASVIGSESSLLSGETVFRFDAPISLVQGRRYFVGISSSDTFGLGLRASDASTYPYGAEAFFVTGELGLTEHFTLRDTAFRILTAAAN
jgi:hypothetical protein